MAAHDLLRNIAAARGVKLAFDFDDIIRPEKRALFYEKYKALNNFFKHADKDPEGSADLPGMIRLNEIEISNSCWSYAALFGGGTAHMKVFQTRRGLNTPSAFSGSAKPRGHRPAHAASRKVAVAITC